jgi:hypothetical protein
MIDESGILGNNDSRTNPMARIECTGENLHRPVEGMDGIFYVIPGADQGLIEGRACGQSVLFTFDLHF